MKRVLLVALLTLSACGGDAGPEVTIRGRSFEPATLTISVGDSVMWRNTESEPHTITAYDDSIPPEGRYFSSGGFDSEEEARKEVAAGLIEAGDALSVGFEVPGTYEYFCIPHEDQGMKGTIIVEEAG